MKRIVFLFICCVLFTQSFGQITQESILKKIDKTLLFYESKKDSIKIMAEEIRSDANKIGLKKEASYYYRFIGFYYEYDGKLEKAAESYLTYLKTAEENGFVDEKYQAIGDIFNIYYNTNRIPEAKKLLLKGIYEGQKEKANQRRLSTYYTNLGTIYRNEGKYDSSYQCYTNSLKIKEVIKDSVGIADVKINLATLLIKQGKYSEAKPYVVQNIEFHKKMKFEEDLWYDYSNLASIYLNTNQKSEAEKYAIECLSISKKIESKPKEHLSIGGLADVYAHFGDYKKAYKYFVSYDSLGKSLLNLETNQSITDLREKYESEKKEQENKLLNQQLEQQKQRQVAFMIGLIGLFIFSSIIGYFWYKNRQKNKLIEHQNYRLSELNKEKNNLISMVSHDLSTPFLTIKTWNNILKMNIKDNPKAIEAAEVIQQSSDNGISLIKKILDVEKAETNQHELSLERFDLMSSVNHVITEFSEIAATKKIELLNTSIPKNISILSDKHLINRLLENLISNAIKYSNSDSKVWINVEERTEKILLKIRDEGIGIAQSELPNLFSKYGTATSKPTAGEVSTGLGLSIVKRILNEIGGEISVQSELGKGSEFTVILKK
ncbi:MAG: ATP-binding protein [Spirosomataceae bacterium]